MEIRNSEHVLNILTLKRQDHQRNSNYEIEFNNQTMTETNVANEENLIFLFVAWKITANARNSIFFYPLIKK